MLVLCNIEGIGMFIDKGVDMENKKDLTEEELKEIRRRKRALRKKRLEKKKALEQLRMRSLLDEEEKSEPPETAEERCRRLYTKAKKKMGFAPHMYRREDQADMYRQAAELFGEAAGYEEADALREECRERAKEHRALYIEETYALINEQLAQAKTLVDCHKMRKNINAIADFKDVEAQRRACDDLEQRLLRRERNQKILKIFAAAVVCVAAAVVIIYIQGTVRI